MPGEWNHSLFQIPVVSELPVGLNLQDHASIDLSMFFDDTQSAGTVDLSKFKTISSIFKHFAFGTGKGSSTTVF